MSTAGMQVAVYGAYGHTGRFVVAELRRRGFRPIACGRDGDALEAMAAADAMPLPCRRAAIDDPASLDRALDGVAAVINCAGSFLDTGAPLVEAALRAGVHCVDLAAEQRAVQERFEQHARAAERAGIVVVPGMAFYGGLGDLLVAAAMHDWPDAEAVEIAVALDSWHPTPGTRRTGERNRHRRLVVSGGALVPLADPPPSCEWTFAAPFGRQAMVAMPFTETVLIPSHLRVGSVDAWINASSLQDIRDPSTPPPVASDASGRSPQRFAIEARVRREGERRFALASGRDIYAASAPLAVEAVERILAGAVRGAGVLAPGAAFDARSFLAALAAHDIRSTLQ